MFRQLFNHRCGWILMIVGLGLSGCGAPATPALPTALPTTVPTAVPTATATAAAPTPWVRAEGNHLIDVHGETVRLRGLMPPDPVIMVQGSDMNRDFFVEMKETGANVIRIPVHPGHWKQKGDYLTRYLDPIVQWGEELGLVIILDWHSIGNVETGEAPTMPALYCHTRESTLEFWKGIARHFRTAPNVVFEIFNEPQGIAADAWQRNATEIVAAIRAEGAPQLILVGGLEYARELAWVLETPIADDNVAYVAHIYPAHTAWDTFFGDVAEKYPVLITEWGFMDENRNAKQNYLAGSAEDYGQPFMDYLDERGIGWTACWYHDTWAPNMLKGPGRFTRFGQFVLEQLGTGETRSVKP